MLTWRREIPFVGFKCLLYYIYIYKYINNHNKTYTSWWFQPFWKNTSPIISLHICIFHKDLWIKHYHLSLHFFTNISCANLKGITFFLQCFLVESKTWVRSLPSSCYLGISHVWSCQLLLYLLNKTEGHFKSEKNISKSSTLSPASLRISQHTPRIWTPNRFCFKHPTTRDATQTSHAPMIWEAPTNDGTQLTDSFRSLCWMFLGKSLQFGSTCTPNPVIVVTTKSN